MSAGSWFSPLSRGAASGFFASGGFGFSLKKQKGFVYVGLLIFTALTGGALVAFSEIASHAAQREKEAELLFRGGQYRQAIAEYHRARQRYPQSLEQLLGDKDSTLPVRHLRTLYPDPITGGAFALIEAPEGGIMGVHSPSSDAPLKVGNFSKSNQTFTGAAAYADWKFVHSPLGLSAPIDKAPAK